MTLDYCRVSLERVFAIGQAYVALSRARSLEGLQIVGRAEPKCVRVSDTVRDYYAAVAAGCGLR
jgi:hypothetical protein